MLWSIRQNLKRLSRLAEPRPAFQRALRKELVVPRPWFVAVLKPAFATVSIVTMLGAGTATYAYTSDDVVPDHPLYPIREQVERVEEAIAVTPATVSIVPMLGAGTATSAYTSDDVVPDHPLYPIREQVERVEEAIAVTPA